MDSLGQAENNAVSVSASPKSVKRRFYSVEMKRRVVEETLKPNASVACIARANGVNANQVFFWRKQYQQGLLEITTKKAELLPVKITEAEEAKPNISIVDPEKSALNQSAAQTLGSGTIHIELAQAKLSIQGAADPGTLRMVLERLLR